MITRRLVARPVGAFAALAALMLAVPAVAGADVVTVASVSPAARALTAPVGATIAVEFDRPIAPASVTRDTFWAFARWSGAVEGAISFENGNRTARLTPDFPFTNGESVMVILSNAIEGADGTPFRPAGYSYQFWTVAGTCGMVYDEIDVMTTGGNTIPYGGIASDLDGDRFLDITTVNEATADLRIYMNRADGTGLFDPVVTNYDVGDRASPSEPSDFNRDGNVDITTADIDDDTVSVLLGNGDGSFGPRQTLVVGDAPRGIAVLDVDGDGDIDIVNTNSGAGSDLSIHFNDGSGVFGGRTDFDAGVSGEWSLVAGDMDEDGILDLVVGSRTAQSVVIASGNGDGTFSNGPATSIGGQTWMLNCGDVNGDGHEDIASANSGQNNGAILLGDGAGGFGALVTYPTDAFPLATDLADLDGDGDLDWVTSSFQGDWRIFRNNGDGIMIFDQEINAVSAASCSLPMDIDNDGDLDLALIDEVADLVTIMRCAGSPCVGDLDNSGAVDFGDILAILGAWGSAGGPEDLDGSGTVDFGDLLVVLGNWGDC